MGDTPQYSQPPLDPLVTEAQQQAQQQLIDGLQTQSRSDSASLMAQYGSLATAMGGLPGSTASSVIAPSGFRGS